ncbi:MAG: HAMP domain-containing protein [Gammaproteobacteria bacterium]|nr:MAG: HAMP domain-containing protein [Gammaproteobacteria bacterium]
MMKFISNIIDTINGAIRYKLLVLVLFPILLAMPIALGLAILWGTNFTYEQLFIKVNTDLSVSHDIFERIRKDYLNQLERLGESYIFRTALMANDETQLGELLETLHEKGEFSYLHLLNREGQYRTGEDSLKNARSSSALLNAFQGNMSVGIEIFSTSDLVNISQELNQQATMGLIDTPRARPSEKTREVRGMMIRALYPIMGAHGEVMAIIDGGILLNDNFHFVDTIRDLVYGQGSLPEGSIGTVTVFLDDVRITTNVPLHGNERALGTRVSNEVRTHVLDNGKVWIDRAFVVNDWYISSYEPIIDIDGNRVGMLYAGYLESPYRVALWKALAALVLLFLGLMLLLSVVSILGAKSIFRPLESMNSVVQATTSGDDASRIGMINSSDELGELARGFDHMLDLLQQRNEEVLQWADHLEDKVSERTAELMQKNEDLHRTISVLRQTRQQLVIAEKLAAVGELTAGVAHEINNPTQVILGNLDVLVSQLGDAIEPARSEVNLVVEQVYRIQGIINNLLQYARPDEYVGYPANLTDVNVNTVIKDTMQLVQHLHKGRQFAIQLALEASIKVQINSQELQQVLVNLTVNAVHALTDNDGTITIRSKNWEDKGVCIHVKDNGDGIPEENLENIFNPFFSTKEQGEGTGLGLSVSYGLIRKYGGTISVKSTPNEYTEFIIWLLKEPEWIEDEETIAEQLHAFEGNAGQGSDKDLSEDAA